MAMLRADRKVVDDPSTLAVVKDAVESRRDKAPDELATAEVQRQRKEFLEQSLGETRAPEQIDRIYERILGGNDLMPIAYLQRGAIAARAVARVDLGGGSFGTGFLIAPGVLITNNHVLQNTATAARAVAHFHYEVDLADAPVGPIVAELKPEKLFFTSPQNQLDFSVVAVDGAIPLAQYGFLPLLETTGKVSEGEWLTIIQHPNGGRKQICVRENKLIQRKDDVLWYTTDTEPGSSGSPVFNNDWFVVALHHAGVPDPQQKSPDGSPKWIANEGIRVSRIVQTLKQALPTHPLLQPLYNATPASARISEPPNLGPLTANPSPPRPASRPKESTVMAESRIISVPFEARFQVTADGQVIPLPGAPRGTESFGGGLSAEDLDLLEKAKAKKKPAKFDAPFNPDYSTRKGYDAKYLGGGDKIVGFPKFSDALEEQVAPLIKPTKENKFFLHYINYSVVMHKTRRFAIYSAANVSFANRFEMSRPPDVWRTDPRIAAEHQVGAFYYKNNQFDRGHLTRREDLEYGPAPKDALASAGDTCHYTNSTPQHAQFNQNKEIWQGIERHVLEDAIVNGRFDAQIITGSVFDEGDPAYKDIQYPLQYWKVVAAINSKDDLFATAFIASQEAVIDKFGIEVTEIPIGPFKTFQTKISEIERLTGLRFVSGAAGTTSLSKADPLEKPGAKPKKKKKSGFESTAAVVLPEHYYEISDLDDVIAVP
jgi:endonuclease G